MIVVENIKLNEVKPVKNEEEKYNKAFVLNFARRCMMDLCTKEFTRDQEGMYPEISGYDLTRIEKILDNAEEILH